MVEMYSHVSICLVVKDYMTPRGPAAAGPLVPMLLLAYFSEV
jgi:hypothetical protein